jgi:MFS family permease
VTRLRAGAGRHCARPVRLGLRENAAQFGLLVTVNAFVGAVVGVERTGVPLLAEDTFGLNGATAIATFVLAFGLAKALTNLAAGAFAAQVGRRRLLLIGWSVAAPVPVLLLLAPSWSWVIGANVLLGVSQGLTWSTTVLMKIDLVGPSRRGLALGLNEAAGYGAVAVAAYAAGVLSGEHGPDSAPFLLLGGLVAAGALLSLAVQDTAPHVALEQATHHGDDAQQAKPFGAALSAGTWGDRRLSAVSAAGLANNLNDAYAWALLPLLLLARGLTAPQVALVAATYPAVWGFGQLGAGALSDRVGRRPLLSTGFTLQTVALLALLPDAGFAAAAGAAALLGAGTALVYPTLLATITDLVGPSDRPAALGVYRLWRDLGYVAGAVIAGGTSDLLGPTAAIAVVAALTGTAGVHLHRALRGEVGSHTPSRMGRSGAPLQLTEKQQ